MKNDINENKALSQTSVMVSADLKKECLHKFHSVYYGSEWVVECEKCEKDVYDLYSVEDGTKIINDLLKK